MLYVFQYLPFMKTESLLFSAPQDEISVINAALGKLRCHSSSGKNVNVTSFREREREKHKEKERARDYVQDTNGKNG